MEEFIEILNEIKNMILFVPVSPEQIVAYIDQEKEKIRSKDSQYMEELIDDLK